MSTYGLHLIQPLTPSGDVASIGIVVASLLLVSLICSGGAVQGVFPPLSGDAMKLSQIWGR